MKLYPIRSSLNALLLAAIAALIVIQRNDDGGLLMAWDAHRGLLIAYALGILGLAWNGAIAALDLMRGHPLERMVWDAEEERDRAIDAWQTGATSLWFRRDIDAINAELRKAR